MITLLYNQTDVAVTTLPRCLGLLLHPSPRVIHPAPLISIRAVEVPATSWCYTAVRPPQQTHTNSSVRFLMAYYNTV